MKRFLIFTVLFPPLVLLVFLAVEPSLRNPNLLPSMLPDAYLFGLVPAWVLAGVDWAVSAKPRYLRLSGAALAGAAGVMTALVVLHFGEILTGGVAFLMIALIGAIPAAVCSWLSDKPIKA